jgi:DNA-binding MarR family transcriptional regulator
MTQSQLAEELDLGKVAIGGLIDRLEKTGLVRREADAGDRRINRIFLEPTSKQLITKMRKLSHQLNQQILAGLPDTQLETAAVTLDTMKHNLLTYLSADS